MSEQPTDIKDGPNRPKEITGVAETDYVLDQLGITPEMYSASLIQKERLQANGIPLSFSTIEGANHLGDIWAPGEGGVPKISLEMLAYYLPDELRREGVELGFFRDEDAATADMKKAEFRTQAQAFVLGAVGTGQILMEAHNETNDGAIDRGQWSYAIKLYQLLNANKAQDANISAHLAFLVNRGETAEGSPERKKLFFEGPAGIAQISPSVDLTDARVRRALEIMWESPHGFAEGDKRRLNFFTFEISGQLDSKILAHLQEAMPDEVERADLRTLLKDTMASYSQSLLKAQIEAKEPLEVKEFTLHAGDLGTFLTEDEFVRFQANIKDLAAFAGTKKALVQIETQALSANQWKRLLEDDELRQHWGESLGVTLDVIHVMQEKAISDALPEGAVAGRLDFDKDQFGDRMTLTDWQKIIEDNTRQVVTEVHLSYSRKTNGESLKMYGFGFDDHLPFSKARGDSEYLGSVVPVIETVAKGNIGIDPEKGERRKIKVVEEATLVHDDIVFLNEVLSP